MDPSWGVGHGISSPCSQKKHLVFEGIPMTYGLTAVNYGVSYSRFQPWPMTYHSFFRFYSSRKTHYVTWILTTNVATGIGMYIASEFLHLHRFTLGSLG